MKNSLAGLLQQAQKMQEQLQSAQAELKQIEVTGEAGGGLVKVTMNGHHQVRSVTIVPSLLADGDAELLADLTAAAVNDAVRRVSEVGAEKMSGLTGGLNLPAGFPKIF